MLPNDAVVFIDRSQVNVLLDFAMSDYSSQGRTRPINVCHLKHCRGHQSIYTCLSRSASLSGTLILGGFDASKLTGGINGDLRREFRELEILDDICRLRFHDELPHSIVGCTRASLIKCFQSVFGIRYVPANVDAALDWRNEPTPALLPPIEPVAWRLIGKNSSHQCPFNTPSANILFGSTDIPWSNDANRRSKEDHQRR